MIKTLAWLALAAGGFVIGVIGFIGLLDTAREVRSPLELVVLVVTFLVTFIAMSWLYRWWSTR